MSNHEVLFWCSDRIGTGRPEIRETIQSSEKIKNFNTLGQLKLICLGFSAEETSLEGRLNMLGDSFSFPRIQKYHLQDVSDRNKVQLFNSEAI